LKGKEKKDVEKSRILNRRRVNPQKGEKKIKAALA